jgi:hypothetical protein
MILTRSYLVTVNAVWLILTLMVTVLLTAMTTVPTMPTRLSLVSVVVQHLMSIRMVMVLSTVKRSVIMILTRRILAPVAVVLQTPSLVYAHALVTPLLIP